MQSSRYKDATRETNVRDDITIKEQEKIRQTHEREELRRLKKEQKRDELMSSWLFNLLYKYIRNGGISIGSSIRAIL